jgi:hypothetical protein
MSEYKKIIQKNTISTRILYKYNFSSNSIEFDLIHATKEIWMEQVKIDYNNSKIFILLLRNAINDFITDGYTIFVQTILTEDWEIIKNETWNIRLQENGISIIFCDINDALINIVHGLGFKK